MNSAKRQVDEKEEVDLYTWYRAEKALKHFLIKDMQVLPKWAIRKGYKDVQELHKAYQDRLVYEYGVIKKMGFCGYFLIVADGIEFCRKESIPVGPGRGSASGCLLSYLLKITNIDPIKYDLLFERFLNPERFSLPDIDSDFSQASRHRVKEHYTEKYGASNVASIATFSRMKVRAAIRDVVRSLNLGGTPGETFRLADKIAKTLEDSGEDITFADAMHIEEFRAYMKQYPILAEHIRRCEGILRQMSMHAAGVLISARPLDQELPLIRDKNKMVVAAQDGPTCEAQGYLKLDTLGLKNLDIIAATRQNIENLRGSVPSMELDGIEFSVSEKRHEINERIEQLEDEPLRLASRAYQYLRGEYGKANSTLGIFQCEQPVTQNLLRKALVNSIENIADIIAGIRPGPRKAGSTELYIQRRRKEVPVLYESEEIRLPEPLVNDLIRAQEADRLEKVCRRYIELFENQLKNNNLVANLLQDVPGDINLSYHHPLTDKTPKEAFLELAPSICGYVAILKSLVQALGQDRNMDIRKFVTFTFNFECLAPVCNETQGLPFFQEQLMKISRFVANFTVAGSDVLRKGVGKKDEKLITTIGEAFIAGCQGIVKEPIKIQGMVVVDPIQTPRDNPNGLSKETAAYIWYKFVLPYGKYGFNLSHSISYAFISYECAWLKANFPTEFYAALLSFEDNQTKANEIIGEAKAAGVKFLPPNINKSTENFTLIDENTIVYSLTCMKGVGAKVVEKLVPHRPYISMIDFLGRSGVDTRATGILIKGGAFDNIFEEKVSRKNYFDFFKDCQMKLRRQVDRLLRESLIREFNYRKPNAKQIKEIKAAGGTYETPSQFHSRMLETNEEYQERYRIESVKRIREFSYEWTGPITTLTSGEAFAVERESKTGEVETRIDKDGNEFQYEIRDERPAWEQEEIWDFEEAIFGTVLSGHRLDPYKHLEENFVENADRHQMTYHRLTVDLDTYENEQLIYIFCRGLEMVKKSPYRKDKSQYRRLFAIEDRYGKALVAVFDHQYKNYMKKSKMNPLALMANKQPYNPVMILKCKVSEFRGDKNLIFDSIVEWVNEEEIKSAWREAKAKELQK